MPEPYKFQVKDWLGRTVRMSRRNFDIHALRRVETTEYVVEAQQVIRDSDLIIENEGGNYLCSFGLGKGKYRHCHLVVVVHYHMNEGVVKDGTVSTYHFMRMLPEGPKEIRYMWMSGARYRMEGRQHG
jgi:hypothetical protein